MECMVARERTAGARRECLAQMFRRHVPDGREVRRCVRPNVASLRKATTSGGSCVRMLSQAVVGRHMDPRLS